MRYMSNLCSMAGTHYAPKLEFFPSSDEEIERCLERFADKGIPQIKDYLDLDDSKIVASVPENNENVDENLKETDDKMDEKVKETDDKMEGKDKENDDNMDKKVIKNDYNVDEKVDTEDKSKVYILSSR